jgi:hypothetical protein
MEKASAMSQQISESQELLSGDCRAANGPYSGSFQALCQACEGMVYEYLHPAGLIIWAEQCRQVLGYSPEEMGSDIQSWQACVHASDRPWVVAARESALFAGESLCLEYRVRHRNGSYLWVRDRNCVRRDYKDGSLHVVGYLRDITEAKKREEEIGQARRAIDSSINGIALVDPQGQLTYVNNSFLKLMGYDRPEDLLGKQVGVFWKHSKKAVVVLRALQSQGEWSGEMVAVRRDGTPAHFQISAHLVTDTSGEPLCFMASFVDITEHKKAEQSMRESEEKYRLLFSSCSDAIIVMDARNYRIVDVNQTAMALYGYSRDEFLALDVLDLSEEPEQSRIRLNQIAAGSLRHFPMVYHRRKDGSSFEVEVSMGFFRWKRCRLLAGFFRDVSERQRIERIKDDMLSAVSHEMRTPLTAILGFTDFLLKTSVPLPKQQDYLHIIQQQGERLKELVDNHLNLQRLRAGYGVGNVQPVEVLPLLHGVLGMFAQAHGGHGIRIECPDHLPPVRGDENQLYRAFFNLLSNAVKYSPSGGEIVLGAYRDRDYVVLFVKDQGMGIPLQHQERIFERFFRVSADGQGISGTGLGLTLVQEIVKAHNGCIRVRSAPDRGSTFLVSLPSWK